MDTNPLADMQIITNSLMENPAIIKQFDHVARNLLDQYAAQLPHERFSVQNCINTYSQITGDTHDDENELMLRALNHYLYMTIATAKNINLTDKLHKNNAPFISNIKCSIVLKDELVLRGFHV